MYMYHTVILLRYQENRFNGWTVFKTRIAQLTNRIRNWKCVFFKESCNSSVFNSVTFDIVYSQLPTFSVYVHYSMHFIIKAYRFHYAHSNCIRVHIKAAQKYFSLHRSNVVHEQTAVVSLYYICSSLFINKIHLHMCMIWCMSVGSRCKHKLVLRKSSQKCSFNT